MEFKTGLTPESERIYTTNLLLEMFGEDNYEDCPVEDTEIELESVLKELLDESVKEGLSRTVSDTGISLTRSL